MNQGTDAETRDRQSHQAVDHRDDRQHQGPDGDDRERERTEGATGRDRPHRQREALVAGDDRDAYRERWDHLQASFVDDPRGSTEAADELLRETFEDVTTRLRDRHERIRDGWSGSDASTEELRTTLRRYRDAFERLLSF